MQNEFYGSAPSQQAPDPSTISAGSSAVHSSPTETVLEILQMNLLQFIAFDMVFMATFPVFWHLMPTSQILNVEQRTGGGASPSGKGTRRAPCMCPVSRPAAWPCASACSVMAGVLAVSQPHSHIHCRAVFSLTLLQAHSTSR